MKVNSVQQIVRVMMFAIVNHIVNPNVCVMTIVIVNPKIVYRIVDVIYIVAVNLIILVFVIVMDIVHVKLNLV